MEQNDFLHQLKVALGFTDLIPVKEPDIIKEILRLREAAGETDSDRSPFEMEHVTVESLRGVPVGSRDGGPPPRIFSLWITTKAEHVEQSSQVKGGPWKKDVLELPQRQISFMMGENEAREAHRILDEKIEEWDLEGS